MRLEPIAFTLLLSFAIFSLSSGKAHAIETAAIDQTLTDKGDMTGDGEADYLRLHIVAKSIHDPFKWSFTITDRYRNVLYRVDRDDSNVDSLFRENGYVSDCGDYISCKKKYYFSDLPAALFSGLHPSTTAWLIGSRTSNLLATSTAFLVAHGVAGDIIKTSQIEMKFKLSKPGFHALGIPISPVQNGPPMIWVSAAQLFVPFYQE